MDVHLESTSQTRENDELIQRGSHDQRYYNATSCFGPLPLVERHSILSIDRRRIGSGEINTVGSCS